MPLISVWPVSLSAFTLNVGSSQLEHVQRVGQLVLVRRRLRLDRLADDRLGERDRLQQDRVLRLAERVAGDRVLQADDARRCRRPGRSRHFLQLAVGSAWMWYSLRDVLLHVLAGVVRPAVRLQRCRSRCGRRTGRRSGAGDDLEHQPAERLLRVGLALLLLVLLLRVGARRPAAGRAGWAGSSVTASSSGWMPMCSRPRAAQHRLNRAARSVCSRISCADRLAGIGSCPSRYALT